MSISRTIYAQILDAVEDVPVKLQLHISAASGKVELSLAELPCSTWIEVTGSELPGSTPKYDSRNLLGLRDQDSWQLIARVIGGSVWYVHYKAIG